MDNFKAIYRILRYLEKAMDYDEPDMDFISAGRLKLTEQRWISIMELLAANGYVSGVDVKRTLDGGSHIAFSDLRITLKGLEYLQENSLMQKAASLAWCFASIKEKKKPPTALQRS